MQDKMFNDILDSIISNAIPDEKDIYENCQTILIVPFFLSPFNLSY